jgi:predicted MFS family arabinose efflux permease
LKIEIGTNPGLFSNAAMLDPESADDFESDEVFAAKNSKLTDGLSALRHREFRLLWLGTFVSNIGSWAQKVATAWLVYHITNSEAWLGIDAFASGIPTVLLLPWGGVVSDRINRRSLLIWTNLVSAGLAFVLAALVLSDMLQVWHIVVVSALSGVVQALIVPASTSILPTLVGERDTANAIALNSLQFNVSRVIGPAIGGATLIYLGASYSFALNGLSFLAMVAVLLSVTIVPAAKPAAESVGKNFRAGLQFVKEAGNIRTLLSLVMLAAFLGAPMISMMPALTKSVLHREASTYSLLLSSFGVGAVIAAGYVALRSGRSPKPCRAVPYLNIYGACLIAVAFQLPVPIVVLLVALSGFAFIGTMIRLGTAIVQATPDEYRGRVTSLQSLGFRLGQPLGSLVAGFFAHELGVQIAFWTFGALLIAAVFIARELSASLRMHKLMP